MLKNIRKKPTKTFEIEDEDGDVWGKACYDSIKVGDISLEHFGFVLVKFKFIRPIKKGL